MLASNVHADPADDAMAKLNELSRQAEQTTEAMHAAQLDLGKKLEVQATADKQLTDAQANVTSAQAQLSMFQSSVDKVAAAMYMGGRTDGMAAILTAESPQGLIDKLAMQRVMATEMSAQMTNYQQAQRRGNRRPGRHGQVGRRRQDSRRAGCRRACRPAVQAEPVAVADRRREVAVHGAHAQSAGGARGARTGARRSRPAPTCWLRPRMSLRPKGFRRATSPRPRPR